jgi:CheY-like chemotaxis protein
VKTYNILIVDDEPLHISLMKESIESIGSPKIKIYSYSNGLEAFKHLKSYFNYQIIFIDIKMNDVDGLALVRYLSKNKAFDNTYIAVISSSVSMDHIDIAHNNGADAYIVKPIRGSLDDFNVISDIVRGVRKGSLKKRVFNTFGTD